MGSLAGVKTMNLAMEDKIKEGFYALCLAILKGYSVSEAFHALEMPNWKKDPSKIDIWATAQERSVTETAKECGCSVSTVKRCKRMKLEQQSLWNVFGNDLKNKTY